MHWVKSCFLLFFRAFFKIIDLKLTVKVYCQKIGIVYTKFDTQKTRISNGKNLYLEKRIRYKFPHLHTLINEGSHQWPQKLLHQIIFFAYFLPRICGRNIQWQSYIIQLLKKYFSSLPTYLHSCSFMIPALGMYGVKWP